LLDSASTSLVVSFLGVEDARAQAADDAPRGGTADPNPTGSTSGSSENRPTA